MTCLQTAVNGHSDVYLYVQMWSWREGEGKEGRTDGMLVLPFDVASYLCFPVA